MEEENMDSLFDNEFNLSEFNNYLDDMKNSICDNSDYLTEYLKQHIGKMVKLEFFLGNSLEIRIGQLIEVGKGCVILRLYKPSTTIVCDTKDIKFITIAHSNEVKSLI